MKLLAPRGTKSIQLPDGLILWIRDDGSVDVPGYIVPDLKFAGFKDAPADPIQTPIVDPTPSAIQELCSLAKSTFETVNKLAETIASKPPQPISLTVQPPKRQAKKVTASRSEDGKLIAHVRYEDDE